MRASSSGDPVLLDMVETRFVMRGMCEVWSLVLGK